jgi:S1-C subfamily serine protease
MNYSKIVTPFFTFLLLISPLSSALETTEPPLQINTSTTNNSLKSAIVKIYTVSKKSNYKTPWNSKTVGMTGSGSIIANQRILTNAHVVADSTFIEVKRYGKTKRYEAHVVSVSHEADLAILEVTDKDFFNDASVLSLGELPKTQQEVLVYGFPTGGDTMSVTKGVVSRIEYQRYAHSGERLLAVQVDAAINSGNSGGPIISDGKLIGVVMQKQRKAENIGYMVPIPILKHFLSDLEDGKRNGFPGFGVQTQDMQNSAIRKMYKVPEDQTGALVYHINYNSPAKGIIEVGDVITAIDGHNVTDTEQVEYRKGEYISHWYYLDLHQIGETVNFDILRAGQEKKVSVKLARAYNPYRLVPYQRYDREPSYFIWGGFVFTPLTTNYMAEAKWTPEESYQWSSEDQQEVVVLSQVLADSVNKGYHNIADIIVAKINGQRFANMQQFYQILTQSKQDFIIFEDKFGYQVIMDRLAVEARNEPILKRYNIRYGTSLSLSQPKPTPSNETQQAGNQNITPKL